jgi:hypothetical protein
MFGTKKIPHTDHCVKMTVGKAQAPHVPTAELDPLQPCSLGLRPSELEKFTREIDRDHLALGADGLPCRQRRGAGTTAHIQYVRSVSQP